MATLEEVRAKFPQYSDLNDQQLADGLYKKFYSDLPRDEFNKRVGLQTMPEPTTADVVTDTASQGVRGFNRGVDALISLPGQLFGGAVNLVAPGQGDRFKWNNPVSEVMRSEYAKPQTEAGRYADAVGQAIGSSAIPEAALLAKANQARAAGQQATTTLGRIGQEIVDAARANPGSVVAADTAAAVGSGVGQQMAQEGGFGPVGQTIGGVLGAVTPMAVTGVADRIIQPIQKAYANQGRAGAYGKVAEDIPGGVSELADQVAVGASRNSQTVGRRTLDVLGEEMERAGGDVQRAQAATVARLVQEHGISPATARANIRALTQPHANSQLMFGEYPAVAASDATERLRQPGNVDLDTLGRTEASTTQSKIDYLANNGNAQSAQNTRNAIGRRQEDLSPAMRQTLEGIGPQVTPQGGAPRPATIADSAQMIEDARQAGSAAYRAAYQGPINNWELVDRLPRVLQSADNYAAGRAGEQAAALRRAVSQFYIDTPQGRLPMMTLQQIQDARATVRGQITEATRAGRNDIVNTLQPFYQRITQIMERASPQWAQANRQWADMNFLRMGEELGDAFATTAGPRFREQMTEFLRLAPQAQDIVRIHFLQKLYDKLDNLADTASVSKLFANDHNRNMIRALFGDQAAVQFTRAIRDQKVAEVSQRMLANSATHRRGVAQKQIDSETGLVSAFRNANATGVLNWITEMGDQLLRERRNRPMADILTTPMSDTARVAQHLHNMRQQQQRLQQFAQPRIMPTPAIGVGASSLNPMLESGTR